MGSFLFIRADPNAVNIFGRGPIHEAVINLDKKSIAFALGFNQRNLIDDKKKLVVLDINSLSKNYAQLTPLHLSCSIPSLALIILLTNCPNIDLLILSGDLKLAVDLIPKSYLTSRKVLMNLTIKRLKALIYSPLSKTGISGVHAHRKTFNLRMGSKCYPNIEDQFLNPTDRDTNEGMDISLTTKIKMYNNSKPLRSDISQKKSTVMMSRTPSLKSTPSEGIGKIYIPMLNFEVRIPSSSRNKPTFEFRLKQVLYHYVLVDGGY